MTGEFRHHPDLLQRFVPTPFVFIKRSGLHDVCIESNDLEVALGIRQSDLVVGQKNLTGGLFFKVIRDLKAPADDGAVAIIADGVLRVLQMGQGTILIHDRERMELLGFISGSVRVQELVSSLIPALLGA